MNADLNDWRATLSKGGHHVFFGRSLVKDEDPGTISQNLLEGSIFQDWKIIEKAGEIFFWWQGNFTIRYIETLNELIVKRLHDSVVRRLGINNAFNNPGIGENWVMILAAAPEEPEPTPTLERKEIPALAADSQARYPISLRTMRGSREVNVTSTLAAEWNAKTARGGKLTPQEGKSLLERVKQEAGIPGPIFLPDGVTTEMS